MADWNGYIMDISKQFDQGVDDLDVYKRQIQNTSQIKNTVIIKIVKKNTAMETK